VKVDPKKVAQLARRADILVVASEDEPRVCAF
jgi:hypothetical protein